MAVERLTREHVVGVCRLGQGARCCAYLAAGGPVDGLAGWSCAKGMPDVRATIVERLAAGKMVAQSDNCSGPPDYEIGAR